MIEELEMLTNQYCAELQYDWENKCPESLSKKVTFLVDHHPKDLYDSMESYVQNMGYEEEITETDLANVQKPYRDQWKDLAYHILGQYAIKRNG